jgi:2-haloacid dehalogenase
MTMERALQKRLSFVRVERMRQQAFTGPSAKLRRSHQVWLNSVGGICPPAKSPFSIVPPDAMIRFENSGLCDAGTLATLPGNSTWGDVMAGNRREFLTLVASGLVATAGLRSNHAMATGRTAIKAIAFDGLAIFDSRPVVARVRELFGDRGMELANAWRIRQFEYTWLRTLGGNYADFWHVTEDSLLFAAQSLGIELSGDQRDRLMHTYLELDAWPDVQLALQRLKQAGIRMAFLSNFTAAMLEAGVKNARLEGFFEGHLSTDKVRAFKPDPRAYRMAVEAFGLKREEIAFAAFAGWDAAGAGWFGYPTFWINRLNAPSERLDVAPAGMGTGMDGLVKFVLP